MTHLGAGTNALDVILQSGLHHKMIFHGLPPLILATANAGTVIAIQAEKAIGTWAELSTVTEIEILITGVHGIMVEETIVVIVAETAQGMIGGKSLGRVLLSLSRFDSVR